MRKLFGVDGNKNEQWLNFMEKTEESLSKSFSTLSASSNKLYTEKDKRAQKLKEEIDDLKEYLDAAMDNKMISMKEIKNIIVHHNIIDKSDPSYPEVKTKFNNFTDFFKELNEKRDADKVILKDMDDLITSADRLLSEKEPEQKKLKDMHEKGMELDGLMKPLIDFLDAKQQIDYKKFDQMMDKLKLKITDDKGQQAIEDLLKKLEQLTAKVSQTSLNDSEVKDLEAEATNLVEQLKPHSNYLVSDQQDRLKNFKQVMEKGKIKIGDVDQTKKSDKDQTKKDQTGKSSDDQTKKLSDKTDKEGKMSTTKIVLIVVFSVAGVILITVLGIYLYLRRKKMMNIRMEHEIVAVDGEH